MYVDPHPYARTHHYLTNELPNSWRSSLARNCIRYTDIACRALLVASVSASTAGLILIGLCKLVDLGPIQIVVM
jgi:hypothetical protein